MTGWIRKKVAIWMRKDQRDWFEVVKKIYIWKNLGEAFVQKWDSFKIKIGNQSNF